MRFEGFIAEKKVIICTPDHQKAKALVAMAKRNFSFLKEIPEEKIGASVILTQTYEPLRQIMEAIALKEGYKIFSHEAYTYYLRKLQQEIIAEKFDRLRKLRNGVNYYGKPVSLPVALKAKKDVSQMMQQLEKEFLK